MFLCAAAVSACVSREDPYISLQATRLFVNNVLSSVVLIGDDLYNFLSFLLLSFLLFF